MSTSFTSINNLTSESLATIFAYLPPIERVRLERVCQKWRQVAKKYAWTEFRKLALDQEDHMVAMYQAVIDRCGPYLRELSFAVLFDQVYDLELWTKLPNLRHLRFDACVSSGTLRTIADNLNLNDLKLKHLQSIHFSDIYWRTVTELRDLLYINNTSLQALRLPMFDSRGGSLGLPALPSSLRSLQLGDVETGHGHLPLPFTNARTDELLELAATCCPQLAILLLPLRSAVSQQTLATLARFEKLFFLRLFFIPQEVNLFVNSLANSGAQLRALLLEDVDPRVLRLIAMHCPLLEHCYFGGIEYNSGAAEEGIFELSSALQSVFQLSRLRSVSFSMNTYRPTNNLLRTQILARIKGLNAKGKLEFLHLPWRLALPVEFIANLLQLNPKLRMLTCSIQDDQMPEELGMLNTQLRNRDGPLVLELFEHCPPELEMGQNSRIRVRAGRFPESISKPMLRQLWAQAMDSMPDLIDLDLDDC